jgi:hypothetical protein
MTTPYINAEEATKYLNPSEDYSKLDIDLEGRYSLDEKELTNGIDVTDETQMIKIKIDCERLHPRVYINDKIEKHPICSTDTGIMGCGKRLNKSDLHPYGLGIINYFKTIKAYCIIFFIITIINIPVLVMYTQSHPERKIINYQDGIFKTTIGNIASTLYNCLKISTKEFNLPILNENKSKKVKLNCENYVISSINLFGTSNNLIQEVENNQQCQDFSTYQNITISSTCTFNKNVTELVKYCIGNSSNTCEINLDLDKYKEECSNEENVNYFFLGYTCLDNDIPIAIWSLSRNTAAIVVVSIDVACIVIILISIIIIAASQKRNAVHYNETTNQISDYSVHIKNLELDNKKIDHEMNDLLNHLHEVLKKEVPRMENNKLAYLYDYNYPILNDQKLDLILKKNSLIEDKAQLKRELNNRAGEVNEHVDKIKKNFENKNVEYQNVVKKLELVENNIDNVGDVWVTYNRMKYPRALLKAYNRYNKCDRCCLICCFQKKRINHF